MDEDFGVKDDAPISYFTMIPHLVDDTTLSAHAIRLYLHLKRVAGDDGTCWQSQSTLEKHCRMSNRTIVKAKRDLIQAKLIRVQLEPVHGHPQHIIHIRNVWPDNEKCYRGRLTLDPSAERHEDAVSNDTSKDTPRSIPLRRRLSSNQFVAMMQMHLGFPQKVEKDPVPNCPKEGTAIKRMMARGFTWPDIFDCWKAKVKDRGEFVSMTWVNEDIGKDRKDRGNGTHRRRTQETASTCRLRDSVGKPIH